MTDIKLTVCATIVACLVATPLFAHERPSLTAEQREAIAPVIRRLADALEALRGRYAEFDGIQADKIIRATKTSVGVEFTRNFKRPRAKRAPTASDWGAHGISVSFGCVRPFVPDGDHVHASGPPQPIPQLERLGLRLGYEVLVGPGPSDGVRDEVLRILRKHAQMLYAIDKGTSQPAAPADR